MILLDMTQYIEHRVKTHQRLTKAAAYNLGYVFPRQVIKLLRDLGKCRIVVDPE